MSNRYSLFRNWLHNLWVENCEEHYQDNVPPYTQQEYFEKYKWWLKREYKYQREKDNPTS